MKKVCMIIGGIFLALLVIVMILVTYTSLTSQKLVCNSSQGNITIMYNMLGTGDYIHWL